MGNGLLGWLAEPTGGFGLGFLSLFRLTEGDTISLFDTMLFLLVKLCLELGLRQSSRVFRGGVKNELGFRLYISRVFWIWQTAFHR